MEYVVSGSVLRNPSKWTEDCTSTQRRPWSFKWFGHLIVFELFLDIWCPHLVPEFEPRYPFFHYPNLTTTCEGWYFESGGGVGVEPCLTLCNVRMGDMGLCWLYFSRYHPLKYPRISRHWSLGSAWDISSLNCIMSRAVYWQESGDLFSIKNTTICIKSEFKKV